MQIIIPTRGRTEQQLTLSFLPPELRERTTLVCPKLEVVRLSRLYKKVEIVVQPDPNWTIARKREWIMREWLKCGYAKIIMLDDDLVFSARKSADGTSLREIQGEELIPEFQRLADKLGPEFPHVGFGSRLFNNNVASGWKIPGRMMYSLGYYLPIVVAECELGRIETREDMDVTLQLLRKGYPNAVYQTTVNNQAKYDAPGGASNERTIERSNDDAYKLAELHHGYVRVEERDYKSSLQRLEVTCQWQKALRDGLRARHCKVAN